VRDGSTESRARDIANIMRKLSIQPQPVGLPVRRSDEVTVDKLGIKGKRMSRKLEDELKSCDCDFDPTAFRDLLEEQKAVTSPSWTVDELVCHPDKAMEFCEHIRNVAECETLTDPLILRTLMNARRSH